MRLNRQHKHDHHDQDTSARPVPGSGRALRLVPEDPALKAERRMRAAGGPQDVALHRCSCGFIFDAPVTTTVTCPHCNSSIAW